MLKSALNFSEIFYLGSDQQLSRVHSTPAWVQVTLSFISVWNKRTREGRFIHMHRTDWVSDSDLVTGVTVSS